MPKDDKSTVIAVELCPYFHMQWNNTVNENGKLRYNDKPVGISDEMIFDDGNALAHLIVEDVVFLNDHWWKSAVNKKENPWPDNACKTFSINVNCNDVFAWGCADAEELEFEELEDLYKHYQKDPIWGAAVWCIKKRGYMPQKPVEDAILSAGIWDLASMELK